MMTKDTERKVRTTRAQRERRAAIIFWLTVLAAMCTAGPLALYLAVRLARAAWGP